MTRPAALIASLSAAALLALGLFLGLPNRPALSEPDCADALGAASFGGTTRSVTVSTSSVLTIGDAGVGVLAVGQVRGKDAVKVSTRAKGVPVQCVLVAGTVYKLGPGEIRLEGVRPTSPVQDLIGGSHAAADFSVHQA